MIFCITAAHAGAFSEGLSMAVFPPDIAPTKGPNERLNGKLKALEIKTLAIQRVAEPVINLPYDQYAA